MDIATETRTRSLSTKVSEDTYQQVLLLCDQKTPSEWLRALIEERLERQPFEVALMAELLALRRIVVRGLLFPEVEMTRSAVAQLLAETDAEKAHKALTRLGLASSLPEGSTR